MRSGQTGRSSPSPGSQGTLLSYPEDYLEKENQRDSALGDEDTISILKVGRWSKCLGAKWSKYQLISTAWLPYKQPSSYPSQEVRAVSRETDQTKVVILKGTQPGQMPPTARPPGWHAIECKQYPVTGLFLAVCGQARGLPLKKASPMKENTKRNRKKIVRGKK